MAALFANQREANLQSTIALVEAVIGELGYPSEPVAGALPAWRLAKGSAAASVAFVEGVEFTHLRVTAKVMPLDGVADRAALFAHLLELNASLCGAAFALQGEAVYLVAERSTLDLDRSEIESAIRRILETADEHDDALAARFRRP